MSSMTLPPDLLLLISIDFSQWYWTTSPRSDHSGPPPPRDRPLRWFLVDRILIPRNRRHYSPRSSVGGSTCYCAPSASWRRINGSRLDRTTNGRCAIGNWSESIHRSKWLWRPSPSGFSTRKRYHAGGTTGAHEPREPTATGTYSRPKGVVFVAPCLSPSPSFFLSLALSWQFLDSWQRRLVRVISSPIDSKRAHERVANIHGAARQEGLTQEIVVPKVSGITYSHLRSLTPSPTFQICEMLFL